MYWTIIKIDEYLNCDVFFVNLSIQWFMIVVINLWVLIEEILNGDSYWRLLIQWCIIWFSSDKVKWPIPRKGGYLSELVNSVNTRQACFDVHASSISYKLLQSAFSVYDKSTCLSYYKQSWIFFLINTEIIITEKLAYA